MTVAFPVLVVGDANVDLVLRGDVVPRFGQVEQLLDGADLVLGGSASIVAAGLARLGVPTSLAAVVGADEFGRFTRAALDAAGVSTASVRVSDVDPTGVSVILSTQDDRSILTLPGAIPMLTAAEVRSAARESGARWVHFASPFLMPGFATEIPALVAEFSAAGIGSSIDTNWDPSEQWMGLVDVLMAVDVLLPNRAELLAIVAAVAPAGTDVTTPQGAAAAIAALGVRVVVKDGSAGGWSLDASGEAASAPGLVLDVVDTTGAGDSFDAGYLAARAYGVADEQTRLRWAAVAGSLSTRAAGGTGAQATLAELLAIVEAPGTDPA